MRLLFILFMLPCLGIIAEDSSTLTSAPAQLPQQPPAAAPAITPQKELTVADVLVEHHRRLQALEARPQLSPAEIRQAASLQYAPLFMGVISVALLLIAWSLIADKFSFSISRKNKGSP